MGRTKPTGSNRKTLATNAAAKSSAKKHGGTASVKQSSTGTQYNYKDGTGYYVEKQKTTKAKTAKKK